VSRRRALFGFVLIPLVAVLASGCAGSAAELVYLEHEPGSVPYRTRLIASDRFFRIDDGDDAGDFLLFDRDSRFLYSVSGGERSVLVMAPRAVTIPAPFSLVHREQRDTAPVPDVGGHAVAHFRQWTNGMLCYDLYAVADLFPHAVAAWREYRQALAGQQALTVAVTPKEFESPCDLANNVFRPARSLEHGLPVRVTDANGKVSELVDFHTRTPAPARLFALPAGFRRLSVDELRSR
jgi:hypothetical protein